MAKMTIPASSERRPYLPEGTYGINEPVRIQEAEIVLVDENKPELGRYLAIRVMVPSTQGLVSVRTNGRFRDNTSTEPDSGSKAIPFLKNLGFKDPVTEGFDLAALPGMEVVVEVGHRTYTKDGEERHANWIRNIARKQ